MRSTARSFQLPRCPVTPNGPEFRSQARIIAQAEIMNSYPTKSLPLHHRDLPWHLRIRSEIISAPIPSPQNSTQTKVSIASASLPERRLTEITQERSLAFTERNKIGNSPSISALSDFMKWKSFSQAWRRECCCYLVFEYAAEHSNGRFDERYRSSLRLGDLAVEECAENLAGTLTQSPRPKYWAEVDRATRRSDSPVF